LRAAKSSLKIQRRFCQFHQQPKPQRDSHMLMAAASTDSPLP
jgi:hypothetical protein